MGAAPKKKSEDEEYDNEELYNQKIDDEGNPISETIEEISPYEKEYNEVISQMSKICRHIVHNNNSSNSNRKVRIDESEVIELTPRIWSLSTEHDK